MPYIIRPREDQRKTDMRDGKGHDRPMRWICADWFQWYDELPNGVNPEGDVYLQILKVGNEAEAQAKCAALGIPYKNEIIENKPKPIPTKKEETKKPVKPSEYLRMKDKIEVVPEVVAEDIEKAIDSKPFGASFGRIKEPEEEPKQEEPKTEKKIRGRKKKD